MAPALQAISTRVRSRTRRRRSVPGSCARRMRAGRALRCSRRRAPARAMPVTPPPLSACGSACPARRSAPGSACRRRAGAASRHVQADRAGGRRQQDQGPAHGDLLRGIVLRITDHQAHDGQREQRHRSHRDGQARVTRGIASHGSLSRGAGSASWRSARRAVALPILPGERSPFCDLRATPRRGENTVSFQQTTSRLRRPRGPLQGLRPATCRGPAASRGGARRPLALRAPRACGRPACACASAGCWPARPAWPPRPAGPR